MHLYGGFETDAPVSVTSDSVGSFCTSDNICVTPATCELHRESSLNPPGFTVDPCLHSLGGGTYVPPAQPAFFFLSSFMLLCSFEDDRVLHLRPLVETRAAFDLRLGIRSILETAVDAFPDARARLLLHTRSSVAEVTAREHPDATVLSRSDSMPSSEDPVFGGSGILFVNGRWVAEGPALDAIREAVPARDRPCAFVSRPKAAGGEASGAEAASGEASGNELVGNDSSRSDPSDVVVAAWMPQANLPADAIHPNDLSGLFDDLPIERLDAAPTMIDHVWDLLPLIGPSIRRDAAHLLSSDLSPTLSDRSGASVHPSVVATAPERIYIAPGAAIRPGAILDASKGPIYIDRDATVFEQAVVRGPVYLGPKSQIKVQADVADTAIGTWCKVGGEVHDSVFHSYSNKSHPGFLGHSYLGRWCNLGADTNTSNLKNDYGSVSLYVPAERQRVDSGLQFAGLFMGDHSKCGINTMFNTGTVVGTGCNIYGAGFPPGYVPPFSWGGPEHGFSTYRLDKALEVADTVMQRRDTILDAAEADLLRTLHERSAPEREAMTYTP